MASVCRSERSRLCFGCEPSRCRRAQAGVDHGRAVRYFEGLNLATELLIQEYFF